MRVSSLIILLALIGGGVYVFMFTDWITKGRRAATGFLPAKTADEAAQRFAKAVKARDMKTAATYCTGEYANLLTNAHQPVSEVGSTLDQISEYMKNKGWRTDKSVAVVHYFDLMPPQLTPAPAKKIDDKTAEVAFMVDNPGFEGPVTPQLFEQFKGHRPALFQRALLPVTIAPTAFSFAGTVRVVKVGEDWKLDIPVAEIQKANVTEYSNHYKSLYNGLDNFRKDMTNESRTIGTKTDFESRMASAVSESK